MPQSRLVAGMLSVGLMVLGASVVSGQDYPNKPISISTLSLIDAHNHLPKGLTLEHLLKLMDDSGVAMTLLMPVHYGLSKLPGHGIADENLVLEFYRRRPDRIIPFLGMLRPVLFSKQRWLLPDSAAEDLLRFAESQLKTGLFRGMGEFILWHYPYRYPGGFQSGTVKIPANTPLMKRFLELASKYHVPVTIHYELDEESLPSLRRMLSYARQTTIVLAHNGGRPDPTTLKELLDNHPNVFFDLAGMTHLEHYGYTSGEYKKNPIDDGTGHLRPEWKALYEQYADRFVIGTDGADLLAKAKPERYKPIVTTIRSLLSDLSPEASERIGFKNAQRLFVPIKK